MPASNNIRRRKPRREPQSEEALLVSRAKTSTMLGGISTHTLIRMEQKGSLRGVRPSGPGGNVYYRYADLVALAQGGL